MTDEERGAIGWCEFCKESFYVPHAMHFNSCEAYKEYRKMIDYTTYIPRSKPVYRPDQKVILIAVGFYIVTIAILWLCGVLD